MRICSCDAAGPEHASAGFCSTQLAPLCMPAICSADQHGQLNANPSFTEQVLTGLLRKRRINTLCSCVCIQTCASQPEHDPADALSMTAAAQHVVAGTNTWLYWAAFYWPQLALHCTVACCVALCHVIDSHSVLLTVLLEPNGQLAVFSFQLIAEGKVVKSH